MILAWEQSTERERDTRFVELGRYLCEVRTGEAGQSMPSIEVSFHSPSCLAKQARVPKPVWTCSPDTYPVCPSEVVIFKQALAVCEKAMGKEHPEVATILDNYSILLEKTNRKAEAEKAEAHAQAIRAKHAQNNPKRYPGEMKQK